MKGYKALLLDLDGTLLDIEVSFFVGPLIDALENHFTGWVRKGSFRGSLLAGIEAIIERPRRPGQSNGDGFYEVFCPPTGLARKTAERIFEDFYRRAFPTLSRFGRAAPDAGRFVETASRSGYRLALATNPVFPRTATEERLRWTGIAPELFEFLPGLESTSACKPQVEFFLEVAGRLGLHPEECLMVGNDVEHDLEAAAVGMGTFLVDRNLVSRGISQRTPDGSGDLAQLGSSLGFWSG